MSLAQTAGLLAEETRAAFCTALLDGRAWTAGELARHAGVSPSTASEHLTRLISGGLLIEQRQGRHRYVRLAGPIAAALIEDLASFRSSAPTPTTLRESVRMSAEARARTCYDHLAGQLGVTVTAAMLARGVLVDDRGLAVTEAGRAWLTDAGVELPRGARQPARGCLDWTERRVHLAGAVGAALCTHALAAGWVRRIGTGRALTVTGDGRQALHDLLGIEV